MRISGRGWTSSVSPSSVSGASTRPRKRRASPTKRLCSLDPTLSESSERTPCLGVLLCYNDGDLLEESISYLLEQNHDVIAWDHGSTDETPDVLERFRPHLREVRRVPREFDFYELYPAMSHHLLESYVGDYDWISWPDQDEFLEGPARDRSYYEYLVEANDSGVDWIEFRNFNFWCTDEADISIPETTPRSPLLAQAGLPPTHPLLARPGHQHPPLQSQPARWDSVAPPFQSPALPDALPIADTGSRAARPRGAPPRKPELRLREHAPPPRVPRNPGRSPSLRRWHLRAQPRPDLRLGPDLRSRAGGSLTGISTADQPGTNRLVSTARS
jgi:Glycosyl transferase family 2